MAGTAKGKVVQVIGSTFDAEFEEGHLPEIYNALTVDSEGKGVSIHLTGEVQQHLGGELAELAFHRHAHLAGGEGDFAASGLQHGRLGWGLLRLRGCRGGLGPHGLRHGADQRDGQGQAEVQA